MRDREPTANEQRFPFHTRPMADSLAVIEDAGYLEYAQPNVGTICLTVKLKRGWDANYGPDAPNNLNGKSQTFICTATEVHRVAAEMRAYMSCCAF